MKEKNDQWYFNQVWLLLLLWFFFKFSNSFDLILSHPCIALSSNRVSLLFSLIISFFLFSLMSVLFLAAIDKSSLKRVTFLLRNNSYSLNVFTERKLKKVCREYSASHFLTLRRKHSWGLEVKSQSHLQINDLDFIVYSCYSFCLILSICCFPWHFLVHFIAQIHD